MNKLESIIKTADIPVFTTEEVNGDNFTIQKPNGDTFNFEKKDTTVVLTGNDGILTYEYIEKIEITKINNNGATITITGVGNKYNLTTTIYTRNTIGTQEMSGITSTLISPVLAEGNTWYKGTIVEKYQITEINIVSSYTPKSTPTESWNADVDDSGSIKCYVEGTKLIIAGNGARTIKANANSNMMFYDLGTTIIGFDKLDTSDVTEMSEMFSYSRFTNLDLSSFDTSNVTDMGYMFYETMDLVSLNLSSFDTSNVTNMESMFAPTNIQEITLGANFKFVGTTLPDTDSGYWYKSDGTALTPTQVVSDIRIGPTTYYANSNSDSESESEPGHSHTVEKWTDVDDSDTGCQGVCTTCGVTVKKAHNGFGGDGYPETCTQDGYASDWCYDCGHELWSEVYPATGHRWDEGELIEGGQVKYTCDNCGETSIGECKHNSYSSEITEDNYPYYHGHINVCNICGYKWDEESDYLTCDSCEAENENTHIWRLICSICEDSVISSAGHEFEINEYRNVDVSYEDYEQLSRTHHVYWKQCDECYYSEKTLEKHRFENSICQDCEYECAHPNMQFGSSEFDDGTEYSQYCSDCGYSNTYFDRNTGNDTTTGDTACEHYYVLDYKDGCISYYECIYCGDSYSSGEHTYDNGVCTNCGVTDSEYECSHLNNSIHEDECHTWYECFDCGQEYNVVYHHITDGNGICYGCGEYITE